MRNSEGRIVQIRQRRLPHWTAESGTYFITFRLADALSPELAKSIALRRTPHVYADRLLDRGCGRCWLRDERVARIVDDAIRTFDFAQLHAWAIMPNHVHLPARLRPGMTLPEALRRLKGATAREANKVLCSSGRFWQEESYDVLVHDQNDLDRVIDYIEANPSKAGLRGWPWLAIVDRRFSF